MQQPIIYYKFPHQFDDWIKKKQLLNNFCIEIKKQQENEENNIEMNIILDLILSMADKSQNKNIIQQFNNLIKSLNNDQKSLKQLKYVLIPFIAQRALEIENEFAIDHQIEISVIQKPMIYIFTRYQISVILANMFFFTTKKQIQNKGGNLHPHINMQDLWIQNTSCNLSKIQILLFGYFNQIKDLDKNNQFMQEQIFYQRKVTQKNLLSNLLENYGKQKLIEIEINEYKKIEEINNIPYAIGVDFANMYIGGGSLSLGNVQEEIMFATHPEQYISQLFFQVMQANESIYFQNIYKYAQHTGYGGTFTYLQPNQIQSISTQFQTKITAIDAINYNEVGYQYQFDEQYINIELIKSLCGFSKSSLEIMTRNIENQNNDTKGSIITGNWGCGLFGGDVQLKIIIQWIAASLSCRKQIIYCSLGNQSLQDFNILKKKLQNISIEQVYQQMKEYQLVKSQNPITFFEYLNKVFIEK